MTPEILQGFLRNNCFIFHSEYGKKGVTLTTAQRLKNQITNTAQLKNGQNYNIFTGVEGVADIDKDCSEIMDLADDFLPAAGIVFGRESTPTSHALYKVLDLDKKKTRKHFVFRDSAKDNTLIEIRAHSHYTMCGGTYDCGEKVVHTKLGDLTEITYDQLQKQVALLALAAVMLRKSRLPEIDEHNLFFKEFAGVFNQYNLLEDDAVKIFSAVINRGNCMNCKEDFSTRIAQLSSVYKREKGLKTVGLPTIAKKYKWTDNEVEDLKKILYAITGRDTLPDYTNTFVDRIAYMMKQKMYYDLEDKEMYEGESIDVKYAKFFKNGKYTPLKFWKQHPDSKVCVNFTYKPNDKNRFVKVNKKLMINVYEPVGIKPDPTADTDLFDALVKHIIPHDKERDHFLDWFAYPLQYPGVKIRHAIILQSDEFQLGKGSLFDIHRDLLGHHNTNKIDLEQAINREKGFLVDKQTVLIDEAKAKGSWGEKSQFINTLKTLISEGTSGVRALYQGYKEQETCTNYWINTNYKDAFPLPQNEVRYWVYFSDAKRNEKLLTEFHKERLQGNLVAGVMAQLLDRDLSKFNPLGVAPWTKFRDLMHDLADKPVNDYIKESFDQGVYPFDRELITTTETFSWLKEKSRAVRVTREREIADAFTNIGGVRKRNCPVKGVGKSVNIWILHNHDKYKNMSAVELGKIYVGFHTESRTIDAK
jgi:hypothetical protein